MSNLFLNFDYNGIKPQITTWRKFETSQIRGDYKDMLLNNHWVNEEIKGKILKVLDSYRQKDDAGPLSYTIYKTEHKMD